MRPSTARAMVLRQFGQPLEPADLPVPEIEPGGVLVRIEAAGICGSDLEIIDRHDPRVGDDLLPLIPGHEGVGTVIDCDPERVDLLGRPVCPGDLVVWNRGITCGQCNYCAVRRESSLCPSRQVYGISLSAREPYWLNGCYSEALYVRPRSEVLVLPPGTDPATIVPATCSGATAAHGIELAGVQLGDRVLVIGPGPLGLFSAAFALSLGASEVVVAGTERSRSRLELAAEMGCITALTSDLAPGETEPFPVVLDCAGNARSVEQSLELVAPGGVVALPGVASPLGEVCIDVYEKLARRNARLQGVWVSDARHLYQAVSLVQSGRFPLDRLVTHRFPRSAANEALEAVRSRQAVKAVLVPD